MADQWRSKHQVLPPFCKDTVRMKTYQLPARFKRSIFHGNIEYFAYCWWFLVYSFDSEERPQNQGLCQTIQPRRDWFCNQKSPKGKVPGSSRLTTEFCHKIWQTSKYDGYHPFYYFFVHSRKPTHWEAPALFSYLQYLRPALLADVKYWHARKQNNTDQFVFATWYTNTGKSKY